MSEDLREHRTEGHHIEGHIPMEAHHTVLAAVPGVLRIPDAVAVVLHKTAAGHSLLVEGGKGCAKEDIDLAGVGIVHREAGVLAEGDTVPPEVDTALPEVDNNLPAEAAVHTGLEVDTDLAAAGIAVGVVGRTGPDSLAGRRNKTFGTRY